MANEDWVDGDGWISDESDFHAHLSIHSGSENVRRKLESASNRPNVLQLVRDWNQQKSSNPVSSMALSTATAQPHIEDIRPSVQLHNPLEGVEAARQLLETIDQFLKRLPPSTSYGDGAWIWCANPVVGGKGKKAADNHADIDGFTERGEELLEEFEVQRAIVQSENAGKVESTITRKLGPYREKLKEDILKAAIDRRVTSGKWMLFPNMDQLHHTWRLVCEGVIEDRLGSAAKVAVDSSAKSTARNGSPQRLICVYTKDFSDIDNVRRVLEELVELGLTPREGNGVYYKCDAYTYLGIESDNPYKLRASLYSSRDLLTMSKATQSKTKKQAPKKDGSLKTFFKAK